MGAGKSFFIRSLQQRIDRPLADGATAPAGVWLGVELVAVLRKGKTSHKRRTIEAADDFTELVKWRTGSER